MRMQEETKQVELKDTQLLKNLASYAAPYWKMIAFCIALAFLIVVADLARPYLIKVAIDDHINGLSKPMISIAAGQEELIQPGGKPLYWKDRTFYRVDEREVWQASAAPIERTQIFKKDDQYYLVHGWLPQERESIQIRQTSGDSWEVAIDGTAAYSSSLLSPEDIAAFRANDTQGFLALGGLFLVTVVTAAVLSYLQSNLLQYTGQRIIFNIREQLFRHISRMSMSYFDRNPVGRIVVRVTQDTETLNQFYSQVVVNLVKDLIVLFGIVFVMFHLNVELTLLTLIILPILAGMTFWYRKTIREAQRNMRAILSRLNAFLAENLSGIRITQLFIREQRQYEKFHEQNEAFYKAGIHNSTINSVFQPAIGFVGNLAIAMLIWYGGAKVLDGGITFGVVYAFTQYVRQFFNPLLSLADKYNQIQTAMVGAERIFDTLNEPVTMSDAKEPKPIGGQVKGEISFENVWFAYNDEEWVLKDVSFKIQPGQTIAFVGATGAGKSSIIQLINRFYDIQKGSIKLDGIDIRDIPLDQLRKCISIVQQDVFLFTGDISSNIRLNEPSITEAQIEEAVRMVNMDEYIQKLPMKYHTLLGERGINLSLGQRQLLSFARAVAHRPQILILDEATSNIDTETEIVVQDALHNISQGRTTLIVAHRLSTIQHADQIIVMHKGKVREMGNHFQLLAQRGYYYRLYELQYKDQKLSPKVVR
jgi:ATP-binding cassette, subfamily B, multidrug efflux pump